MSTHNIQFHDNVRKFPLIFCFLELSEEFRRDSKKQVRINHGKCAIGVRAVEVRMYTL